MFISSRHIHVSTSVRKRGLSTAFNARQTLPYSNSSNRNAFPSRPSDINSSAIFQIISYPPSSSVPAVVGATVALAARVGAATAVAAAAEGVVGGVAAADGRGVVEARTTLTASATTDAAAPAGGVRRGATGIR